MPNRLNLREENEMSKKLLHRGLQMALGSVISLSLVLTGCGDKGALSQSPTPTSQTSGNSGTGSTPEAQQPEALEPAKLIWYAPTGGTNPPVDEVLAEVNKTLNEKLNVTLDAKIMSWGDYDQKMKLIYASGEPWDLCFTASWMNNFNTNVSKGNFLDITDYIDEYGANLKNVVKDDWWVGASYKGRIYGILNPLGYTQMWGVAVKKDIAVKYNFDVTTVTKLADFEPLLAAVKSGEPGMYALQTIGTQIDNYATSQEQRDRYEELNDYLVLDTVEWKVMSKLELDFMKEGFELVRSWYQKEYIKKDAPTVQDWITEANSGKYAVAMPGVVPTKGETKNPNPSVPYEVQYASLGLKPITTSSLQTCITAINTYSENPERAVMLCDLLNSDKKLYNTLTYGIEGTHWKMTGEDMIAPADPNKQSIDEVISAIAVGSISSVMYSTSEYKKEEKELGLLHDKEATVSPAVGFSYITETLKTEIANVQATYDKYKAVLGAGALDLDANYDKIQDEMKKAGLDKVIEDAQQQVDKWKADNGK